MDPARERNDRVVGSAPVIFTRRAMSPIAAQQPTPESHAASPQPFAPRCASASAATRVPELGKPPTKMV
jgi:hypothetical protein